jgi:hypothetical protein
MMVNLSESGVVLLIRLLQRDVGQKLTASPNPTAEFEGGFEGGLLRRLIAARTAFAAQREVLKATDAAKKAN